MNKKIIAFIVFISVNCFAANSDNIELLKDINPSGSALISVKLVSESTVYFMADDGVHGSELWKTDGTSAGTVLIKDITEGTASSFLSNFVWDEVEQFFYFVETGNIWKSDGSFANTIEIYSRTNASTNAKNLFIHQGKLVFSTSSELLSMNLETQALSVISDFSDGDDGTRAFSSVYFQGYTYFNEKGFRKTDGTSENTELIFPSSHSSQTRPLKPRNLFVHDDYIYFLADSMENGESNLWQSDGTYLGTRLLKDLNPGAADPFALNFENPHFFSYAEKLYFRSYHITYGYEIWSTDGTEENTALFKDVYSGSNNGLVNFTPVVLDEAFYFIGEPGRQLWRSDGTSNGTDVFSELGVSSLTQINQNIYFSGSFRDPITGVFSTPLAWVSEGDLDSTRLINDTPDIAINPSQFNLVNGKLIFVAYDSQNNREWRIVTANDDEACFPIFSENGIAVICL